VAADPLKAVTENRVPVHFTGAQIIKLLTPQVQVLDKCQVTRFSKELEDSAQRKMHHLPLGTRLHRHISCGGGKRPGDGCPGFLSKMGVTIFTGTQVVWDGTRYVAPATQIQSQNFAPCSILSCVHLHQIMIASLKCSFEYVYHHAHTRKTHTHRMVSCVVNDIKVWINH